MHLISIIFPINDSREEWKPKKSTAVALESAAVWKISLTVAKQDSLVGKASAENFHSLVMVTKVTMKETDIRVSLAWGQKSDWCSQEIDIT